MAITGLDGRKSQTIVNWLTFTVFCFLSKNFFMYFWSKKLVNTWNFNASARYPFSFWYNTMVFRNYCFRRISCIGFHKWKQYFGQSVWNITNRNLLFIQFFACVSFWLFVFFFRQYNDSMTAIFILSLDLHSSSSPIVYLYLFTWRLFTRDLTVAILTSAILFLLWS